MLRWTNAASGTILILLATAWNVEAAGLPKDYLMNMEFEGPLDDGERQSCLKLFVQHTQAAACQPLPRPSNWTGPSISADFCRLKGGDYLVNINTPTELKAVFHAYIEGPQILVPPITTCSTVQRNDSSASSPECVQPMSVHRVAIPSLLPGNYSLILRMVVQNFSFGKHFVAPELHGQPLWQFFFDVPKTSTNKMAGSSGPLPVCNSTFLRGSVLSNLTRPGQLNESYGDQDVWQGYLRWQPKGCNLVPVDKINVNSCFKDRLICFLGDSHMRFLHKGVMMTLKQQNPSLKLSIVGEGAKATFDGHESVRVVREVYLEPEKLAEPGLLDGCTDVLANMGAWPLSHRVSARWTTGHYAYEVSRSLQYIKDRLPKARIYWVTAVAHAWQSRGNQSRYPPYMETFNNIAVTVAELHGLRVINTWDIAEPLYLTAYDGHHHPHTGVAGYHFNEYVLNVLCVQKWAR